jgi:hypothetical protein
VKGNAVPKPAKKEGKKMEVEKGEPKKPVVIRLENYN